MGKKVPKVSKHVRHILVCEGGDCASKKKAKKTRKRFKKKLKALRSDRNIGRSMCTGMKCVGPCKGGPIVAVWPDGIWYHNVKKKVADRIIEEHIIGGEPVEDHIFYRVPTEEA